MIINKNIKIRQITTLGAIISIGLISISQFSNTATTGSIFFDFPDTIPTGELSQGDEARIVTTNGYSLNDGKNWSFTIIHMHLEGGLDDNQTVIAQRAGTGQTPNAIITTPTTFSGTPYVASLESQDIFTAGPQDDSNILATEEAKFLKSLTPFSTRINAVKQILTERGSRVRVLGTFAEGITRNSNHYIENNSWQYTAITYNHAQNTIRIYSNGNLVGEHGNVDEQIITSCPQSDIQNTNLIKSAYSWDNLDFMITPNEPHFTNINCALNLRNSNGPFVLGGHAINPISFLNGYINEFRAYTRELSETEIKRWAKNRKAPSRSSLQIEYLFQKDEEDIAVDTSGKNNHGTLLGRVSWVSVTPDKHNRNNRLRRIITDRFNKKYSVTITDSPQKVNSNQIITLRWQSDYPNPFYNVLLSTDGGNSWEIITKSIIHNHYIYKVPELNKTVNNILFKVEITDLLNPIIETVSAPIKYSY
jgi:hypothetical protein